MLPLDPATGELFVELLRIVERLRSDEGCPWDREQTPRTIAPYLIEEAHEAAEAIEDGDAGELCVELGDVLLEVALLAQMLREEGKYTAADSLRAIREKLIRRHPHVFGDESVADSRAVRESWAKLKAKERRGGGALAGVPRRLAALHRARRVSERAAGVGFDWEEAGSVFRKVEEEFAELRRAWETDHAEGIREELGDLLFAVANLARHLDVDPEAALHGSTEKFLARFAHLEATLAKQERTPGEASAEELDELWEAAKGALDAGGGGSDPGARGG
jgi:MazG family protein